MKRSNLGKCPLTKHEPIVDPLKTAQNNIGAVSVPALKTALPRSADFSFIADGRDKWGLGFLITTDQVPGKCSPGSLSWGGINNTYFWIDPGRGTRPER
jgi:methyl acetate hydrolase